MAVLSLAFIVMFTVFILTILVIHILKQKKRVSNFKRFGIASLIFLVLIIGFILFNSNGIVPNILWKNNLIEISPLLEELGCKNNCRYFKPSPAYGSPNPSYECICDMKISKEEIVKIAYMLESKGWKPGKYNDWQALEKSYYKEKFKIIATSSASTGGRILIITEYCRFDDDRECE